MNRTAEVASLLSLRRHLFGFLCQNTFSFTAASRCFHRHSSLLLLLRLLPLPLPLPLLLLSSFLLLLLCFRLPTFRCRCRVYVLFVGTFCLCCGRPLSLRLPPLPHQPLSGESRGAEGGEECEGGGGSTELSIMSGA